MNVYTLIFPSNWYDNSPRDFYRESVWPSPLGLSLGLFTVLVGQILMLIYFCARRAGAFGETRAIQKEGSRKYDLTEALGAHFCQPEGLVMMGGYLIGTWMFGLMPSSYYSFAGGINWKHVLVQLLIQDFVQYAMHLLEHKVAIQSIA